MRVPRDLQELAVRLEPAGEQLSRELGRAAHAHRARRTPRRDPRAVARGARGGRAPIARCRWTARATTTRKADGIGAAFGIEDPGFGEAEDSADGRAR